MLTAQLQAQIEQEAKSSAADFNYFPDSEECVDLESAYVTGATKYAEKWQDAEQRATELRIISTKQRNLLEKFISRHEAGLLPDRFIYDEIKSYLTPKQTTDDTDNG